VTEVVAQVQFGGAQAKVSQWAPKAELGRPRAAERARLVSQVSGMVFNRRWL
jgi:hypothetical protein